MSFRPGSAPRVFIEKCLNYKDTENIPSTARAKEEVIYKENNVRFLLDLSADVYRQQRKYDSVRKKLRDRGFMKQRIIFTARLLLTIGENRNVFDTPAGVEKYIEEMNGSSPGNE